MATILIVDDDGALRRAVATTLSDLGHQPEQAADGASALAWLSRNRADAVLLDLRMPGLDGMDVLRRIRARPDAPPVAVLTAVPTGENTIEAMRLGAASGLPSCTGLAHATSASAMVAVRRAPVPVSQSTCASASVTAATTAMRHSDSMPAGRATSFKALGQRVSKSAGGSARRVTGPRQPPILRS